MAFYLQKRNALVIIKVVKLNVQYISNKALLKWAGTSDVIVEIDWKLKIKAKPQLCMSSI